MSRRSLGSGSPGRGAGDALADHRAGWRRWRRTWSARSPGSSPSVTSRRPVSSSRTTRRWTGSAALVVPADARRVLAARRRAGRRHRPARPLLRADRGPRRLARPPRRSTWSPARRSPPSTTQADARNQPVARRRCMMVSVNAAIRSTSSTPRTSVEAFATAADWFATSVLPSTCAPRADLPRLDAPTTSSPTSATSTRGPPPSSRPGWRRPSRTTSRAPQGQVRVGSGTPAKAEDLYEVLRQTPSLTRPAWNFAFGSGACGLLAASAAARDDHAPGRPRPAARRIHGASAATSVPTASRGAASVPAPHAPARSSRRSRRADGLVAEDTGTPGVDGHRDAAAPGGPLQPVSASDRRGPAAASVRCRALPPTDGSLRSIGDQARRGVPGSRLTA